MPVLSENFSFIQILGDISQNIMHVEDSNHSHTFTILLVLVLASSEEIGGPEDIGGSKGVGASDGASDSEGVVSFDAV